MIINFLLKDKYHQNIDLGHLDTGNPGIGGDLFEEVLLIDYLYRHTGYHPIVYHHNVHRFPAYWDTRQITTFKEAIDDMHRTFCSAPLVVLHGTCDEFFFKISCDYHISVIIWVHNFLQTTYLKLYAKCKAIKRVVFVGRQHYDYYIDDDIIKKSTYVYNMVPSSGLTRDEDFGLNVVYTGSLVKAKGFHLLAKAWKNVISVIPNAHLYVIGSANVYTSKLDMPLGKLGVTTEEYEKKWHDYLVNKEGNLIPSVTFLGKLGKKKYDYYRKCAVGVVNPTGISETFCVSAVEFSDMSIPVVSYRGKGLLDTIEDGITGKLVKGRKELSNAIIRLLSDLEENRKLGKAGSIKAQNFMPERIIKDWLVVFSTYNQHLKLSMPDSYLSYQYKWLKICNYYLKEQFGWRWPSVSYLGRWFVDTSKKYLCRQ